MEPILYINGAPAEIGKLYKDFRGEVHQLVAIEKPHKPSSTGRVYTVEPGYDEQFSTSYFPSVIGGEWVGREDR